MHDHVTGLRLTHLAGALQTTVFLQNTRCNPLLTSERLTTSKTLNLSFEGETRIRSGRHHPAGDGPPRRKATSAASIHHRPRRWWLGDRNRPNTHTEKNSFLRERGPKKRRPMTSQPFSITETGRTFRLTWLADPDRTTNGNTGPGMPSRGT